MSTDRKGAVAQHPPDHVGYEQADYGQSMGLPRRPKSLRDPASAAVAPMAYATLALLVLGVVWAGVRYNDLESETRELAASQVNSAFELADDGTRAEGGGGGGGGSSESDAFPAEEPSEPEPALEPAKTGIIDVPGGALFFDPDELTVPLGVAVLVRNTSQRRCTMTATEGSNVVPAMLEGENNPVLESATDVTANHTVTFLSPDEPGTATLRCDYEVIAGQDSPNSTEAQTTSPADGQSGPSPTSSDTDEESAGEDSNEPTVEVFPSEELTIEWTETG